MIDAILQEALDTCIETMAVRSAIVKSNVTDTTFELRFVYFFADFSFVFMLKQMRTFLFETLKSVPLMSANFKKNNFRRGHMCLIEVHLYA